MRGLRRAGTVVTLLAGLAAGCGSTSDDRLVLRLIGFNGAGLTQADSVRENSADVDIEQDVCSVDQQGIPTFEPFTQTLINAVFRNEEASDIRLERYTVDYGPKSGLPDAFKVFQGALSSNVVGGRCAGGDQPCAVDADCGTVSGTAACEHTDTPVTAILVVDFDVKQRITPGTYNVVITFFGSDANQSFQTSPVGYVMRFDDFNNCSSSGTGAGLS